MPSQRNAVVPGGLAFPFGRAVGFDEHLQDRIVDSRDEDSAVGVLDSDVSRPAVPYSAERYRIEALLREVTPVWSRRKLETESFDADFLDATFCTEDRWSPFESDVGSEATVELDSSSLRVDKKWWE